MLHEDQNFILCDGKLTLAKGSSARTGSGLDRTISVEQLLRNPFSVYILNEHGHTLLINDFGAKVCGYQTPIQSIGKSLFDVSQEEAAQTLIQNSKQVFKSQTLQIFDEVNIRKDNFASQFLSVKLPWYNADSQPMGSIGFSIVLGQNSLSHALSTLGSLGLLSSMQPTPHTICHGPSDIHLTQREKECLNLSMQHYTAKQIAQQLSLSYRTVEEYLANLKQKFGVGSKRELIQRAMNLNHI